MEKTKDQKINKFHYHYEFCERDKLHNMYEEELDRVEQLKRENKKLKAKETPLTVNYIADGYADGYPVYDTVQCPNCAMTFEMEEVDIKQYKYCPYCGQHWNEIKLDYGIDHEALDDNNN